MPKYPHDDDWGDWMHEQRKQKALDKRWDEELERAMRATYSDPAECCQRCGRKGTPPCACATPDRPVEHPDTGWKIL